MRDPLRRLKSLPWFPLLQNAALTILLATALDIALLLILFGLFRIWPEGTNLLVGGGMTQQLLQFTAAGGIGALSVILLERWFRHILLDGATLWASVGCLVLVLYLKGFLQPVPTLFVGLSYLQFVGLMLGLFSQGRTYWRW